LNKNILYIGDTLPHNGIASAVLVYRHLLRLEQEGYKINIIADENLSHGKVCPKTWNVNILPTRKFWYPPYKSYGILKWTRYLILYLSCRRFLKEVNPLTIIGFMDDVFYSGLSAFIANRTQTPCFVFYHDRTERLRFHNDPFMQAVTFKHNSYIINKALKVWTVSPELTYQSTAWETKFKIVPPIPEPIIQKAKWKPSFQQQPVIGYAGSLYNECLEIVVAIGSQLENLGGNLMLMSVQDSNVAFVKGIAQKTEIVATRTTNHACEYMIANTSAFIVAYPEKMDSMPWIDSCFPSKFTQFLQTGLPVLVLAPQESAIGKWCLKNKWLSYSSNYSESGVNSLSKLITKEEYWKQLSNQSIFFSKTDFDAEHIQSLISEDIKAISINKF
jgi:hypothetical protein